MTPPELSRRTRKLSGTKPLNIKHKRGSSDADEAAGGATGAVGLKTALTKKRHKKS